MVVGALGLLTSYDGGVQAVSDISLNSISTNDLGSRASQETVFRPISKYRDPNSSSTRCA